MFLNNRKISLWLFYSVITVLYCFTVILIEFKGVPVNDSYSLVTTSLQFFTVCFCTAGLLMFLSSYRWLFAVIFPVMTLICSVICYFNMTIGSRLTPEIIELTLINDISMWWTMISPILILVIILSLSVGVVVSVVRVRYVSCSKSTQLIYLILGVIVISMPVFFVKRIQAPVCSRLPYSIYYSLKDYISNRSVASEDRDTYSNVTVYAADNAPDVILILGESLRADHVPMNGYERNTMPYLSTDTALISFYNVYSKYTYTHSSVPHILTRYRDSEGYAYEDQSFISLLKKAGYKSAWFANQELASSYVYFSHEADSLYYCNADRTVYSYDKWLDNDILPFFNSWYNDGDSVPKLAVIHTIGSHWWYRSHYTESHSRFKPEITHKDVGGLSKEEMINSYDNTIIATDEFLNNILDIVRNANAIVIFVSDHGEALGEDGLYLHATDTEVLHHPAMMVWYSVRYKTNYPGSIDYLRSIKDDTVHTDHVFDMVVDLSHITVDGEM